jgi:hypothetical protein
MPSRFHVTHYFFISLKKNATLQKLWPLKISCAKGNQLGIPYIFPKLSNTTNRSINAFEVCLKRSFRDITLSRTNEQRNATRHTLIDFDNFCKKVAFPAGASFLCGVGLELKWSIFSANFAAQKLNKSKRKPQLYFTELRLKKKLLYTGRFIKNDLNNISC